MDTNSNDESCVTNTTYINIHSNICINNKVPTSTNEIDRYCKTRNTIILNNTTIINANTNLSIIYHSVYLRQQKKDFDVENKMKK